MNDLARHILARRNRLRLCVLSQGAFSDLDTRRGIVVDPKPSGARRLPSARGSRLRLFGFCESSQA
jgi:hypothetical protein